MSAIERAALAIAKDDPAFEDGTYGFEDYLAMARAAFEVIDVDELARVIERADMQWTYTLGLGGTRHGYIARAVHTYLLTGDESDDE